MRFRSTVILLIIALILGIGIIFLKKNVPTTDELKNVRKNLVSVDAEDIVKIELNKPDQQITCEKDKEKNWQLLAPIKVRADQSEVDNLTNEIARVCITKTIANPKNPSEYGVEKPRLILIVTDKNNQVHQVKIGQDAALEQGIYVQKEGDLNVYLIDSLFWKSFNKSLSDIRDKKVTLINPAQVNCLKISRGNDIIEIVRKDTDKWVMIQPLADKVSAEKMKSYLMDIDGLRARSFEEEHPADLAKYEIKPESLQITISSTNQSETIIFGTVLEHDRSRIYALKTPNYPVITLFCSDFTHLNSSANDFREKKIIDLSFDKIKRMEVIKSGIPFIQMEKADAGWQIVLPAGISIEANAPADFIKQLNETEIAEFVADTITDLANYGLDAPNFQLIFGFTDAQTELKIALAPVNITDTAHTYLRRSDESRVVKVKSDLFNLLKKSRLFFRKKAVLEISPSTVISCTMEKEGITIITCKKEKSDQWQIDSANKDNLDAISKLYGSLHKYYNMVAKDFVEEIPADLSAYGLDKPTYRIEINYTKEDKQPDKKVVFVGKKNNEGDYYGMIENTTVIFLIPADTIMLMEQNVKK